MDTFFISEKPYYINEISPLIVLISYYLIHVNFKTMATYILFFSQLIIVFVVSARYFMQGPSGEYSETGEVINFEAPSIIFQYTVSLVPYIYIIPTIALLVFAIELTKKR